MSFHGDADLKHLGVKETIERIKQVWTVGAKLYGIPESFIRACVGSCPVCCDGSSSSAPKGKRRRQKYIRYKPFMAEVKDYACHRAGEPAAKKSKVLKREPYASKRCGCGFRIRAIVPIANYNEKDKSFVYQEEGVAVFKLYAVHTGHEPGPLDGNARIIHRVVGNKSGELLMDQDTIYAFSPASDAPELKIEVGLLEDKVRENASRGVGSFVTELMDMHSDDVLVVESELAHWGDHHHDQIYVDNKDKELIEEDEDSFRRTLGDACIGTG
ncbi:hypothetical protein IFM89_033018 [Coptis chinensis]|uniref:Uncharacterized protein n=1 Tax=Coptis chinensis TaxID=261450 RepID=A0A835IJT1_9MAGN|nr:hypothetical protein IFM89_033018 [Coptis chinensis]